MRECSAGVVEGGGGVEADAVFIGGLGVPAETCVVDGAPCCCCGGGGGAGVDTGVGEGVGRGMGRRVRRLN